MRRRRRFALPVLVAALSACAQSSQLSGALDDGFDNKPWEIQQAQLPPYPKEESLIPIYVSPTTTFRFFVDAPSVRVGEDGPIRYTLIARSPSGAVNVSYEGIRCETLERKLYAFGRADGTWSQARSPRWVPISAEQVNRHHAALAEDFFCPQRRRVRTTEEALRMLRQDAYSGMPR